MHKALIPIRNVALAKRRKTQPLPQTPIIIPVIVAGVLLGSVWQNKTLTGVCRKTVLFAAIAGLVNSGYAFLVGYLRTAGADSSANSQTAAIATSGLVGFLIVLVVFVSAAGVIKHRRGEELEQQQQQ
jgi:hypothetical protein